MLQDMAYGTYRFYPTLNDQFPAEEGFWETVPVAAVTASVTADTASLHTLSLEQLPETDAFGDTDALLTNPDVVLCCIMYCRLEQPVPLTCHVFECRTTRRYLPYCFHRKCF